MDGGFERVTPLAEARATLRTCVDAHGRTDERPVADARGDVLAAAVSARRDVPHYDRAAMDGYAVRAADTFDASERSPARLAATEDAVEAGSAHAVHTGSPVPDGADAVVRIEGIEDRDGDLSVFEAVAVGENVADAGEDVSDGEPLFEPGHRLRPSDLALLRATGVETVTVAQPPRVAVIPTGDELVDPEVATDLAPGEMVETNGLLVSALVEQWGGRSTSRDVVPDDEDALRAAIERDADHDLVVTTGGSSVGERDLLPEVVDDVGEMLVHGVAIKPGHPVGFGRVDGTPVLVLPGYPVSCLVTAVQFLRPAMAWSTGTEPAGLPSRPALLTEKLPSAPGERTFARVRFGDGAGDDESASEEGELLPDVEPVRVGGAGVMSSVAFADGWVELPESVEGIPAGERVAVQEWERSG